MSQTHNNNHTFKRTFTKGLTNSDELASCSTPEGKEQKEIERRGER